MPKATHLVYQQTQDLNPGKSNFGEATVNHCLGANWKNKPLTIFNIITGDIKDPRNLRNPGFYNIQINDWANL